MHWLTAPQPQVSLPTEDSAEVLSKVFDNPPMNAPASATTLNQNISITANLHTSTTEPLFSATQSLPVSLPAVLSRLKDKIISGEFMILHQCCQKPCSCSPLNHPSLLQFIWLRTMTCLFAPHHLLKKILFSTWMEEWNTYLAILIKDAQACAPQLVAHQRIITSAKN